MTEQIMLKNSIFLGEFENNENKYISYYKYNRYNYFVIVEDKINHFNSKKEAYNFLTNLSK